MEKKFQPAPIDLLGRWVSYGLKRDEVMGLPRAAIRFPDERMRSTCCGKTLGAPLGVAAGPHTQLAQNIVASWLCGARFIELKTVQILDDISVARPCIDSADVTFNCEWSQELSLDESFNEYLNAWVLIHALAHELGQDPNVFFNMSVGYDLKGIQSNKVQRFLKRMRDARDELPRVIEKLTPVFPAIRDLEISPKLSNLVTLSTMHGCPPAEIERIARFMLEDLGIDTWVKLNPTLLGPDLLRGILNRHMGFDVVVEDEAFEHDPKFDDAVQMIRNLEASSKKHGRSFGLKLSNTLEVANHRVVFPSSQKSMYMSGRALHPLTVTLAHRLTEALDGRVGMSFCGGAHAFNFPTLVADGLGPVTTCTDLLKPGGYARLSQYIDSLSNALDNCSARDLDGFIRAGAHGHADSVNVIARENLARHAEQVLADRTLRQRMRPLKTKGKRKLGAFDCIAAPCQEACPTHQNIPEYMHLVSDNRPTDALNVILHTNAMPAVTGRVCDHPCVERCVRNHYDEPLAIRAIKRHAASEASALEQATTTQKSENKIAIVGAGPAGLSAAYYLALAGCSATIFESKKEAGGMVSAVIPTYRLPEAPILEDLERIRAKGVDIRCGVQVGRDLTLDDLKEQGFGSIVLTAGAQKGRTLGIVGEDAEGVFDALDFLDAVRQGRDPKIGPTVLIIGGGNSAMDAARTAVRLAGPSGRVRVVYRRTMDQMPADPDEIQAALDEGVSMQVLRAPVKVVQRDGKVVQLVCSRMELGKVDASGRPRPMVIEGSDSPIACDTIIVGISQEPVHNFLGNRKLKMWRDGTLKVDEETCETSVANIYAGGDLARGPSTVIQAVADGRRIAKAIATRHGLVPQSPPQGTESFSAKELLERRSHQMPAVHEPSRASESRGGFAEVLGPLPVDRAIVEAQRCLACDTMCSLCVTVCPNRANQMYIVEPIRAELPVLSVQDGELIVEGIQAFDVTQNYQIINVADFCNECGNCTTFCPTAGAPFRDKPRFYLNKEEFENAEFDSYYLKQNGSSLEMEAKIDGAKHSLHLSGGKASYRGQNVVVVFDAATLTMLEADAVSEPKDGVSVDLSLAAKMVMLAKAKATLPT